MLEQNVKLDVVEFDNQVTKVVLSGRLDIAGAQSIEDQLHAVASSRKKVVVDLSGVSFLASIGLRTIIMSAKAITAESGKIVLLAPQAGVQKVLQISGIDKLIPIAKDWAAAAAIVSV